jgi:Rps23 Pro-64 3,4-dihydroxylase Tpa1-like proline 4-hydroxylase
MCGNDWRKDLIKTSSLIEIKNNIANERKTEQIVRSHFEKSNEFIITFNKNKDILIVVECKADIKKHESTNKNKFSDYAVDGVLLYASFLLKRIHL